MENEKLVSEYIIVAIINHESLSSSGGFTQDMEAQAKTELNKKAHSAVILCLGNKVLREVTGETTAAGVWSKLETLYMTKSLANKLYLKKKLYTFLNNHTQRKNRRKNDDDEDAGDHETNQTPDLTDYQLARDRERRTRTKPLRFRDESNMAACAFTTAEEEDTHEPLTYQEAVACEDSSKWKAAMEEEMDSLRKNKTWELVDHPAGQKLVSCKWLFKIKEGIEGVQSLVQHTSIWVILALTACKDYELEQLDVKTGFLHGNLEEVIYMRQPPGYEQGKKVRLLKKSLYGLKQSPRQWYKRFDEYMLSNGFKRSSYDSCVYYRSYAPGEYIYLLLYVDDMLIACKSKAEIGSTKSLLKKEFDMQGAREAKTILVMEIVRDRSRKDSEVVTIRDHNANAAGSLMYLMVCTRPDIAYAVSVVSRYLANPGKNHWEAVKWILKYLRGTANGCDVHLEGNGGYNTRWLNKGSFNYKAEYKAPYGGCEGSYLAKGTLVKSWA
ncbi:retrotransposon protein, putative, ty1-copia subclass [Tanacetum coccineum]